MKSKKYNNGLFIFRRDFRMNDNTGLIHLSNHCKNIIPIFIFTPEQITNKNKYRSNNAIQFMMESLFDLRDAIAKKGGTLLFFYGVNDSVVETCIKHMDIDVVGYNLDYTPYAIQRDTEIVKVCSKHGVDVETAFDYYLHEPNTITNNGGETYKKFTPYYDKASQTKVHVPNNATITNFASITHPPHVSLEQMWSKYVDENKMLAVHGGRKEALKRMKSVVYPSDRNDLTTQTSMLSAYIKFGCVSVREVYHNFINNKPFTRQLHWRDFYANILLANSKVLGKSLNSNYDKIKWKTNKKWFDAWCNGTTGFPIVDAGMRQLNTTGYMHNRARLITMCFYIKTLLLDWREAEQYFASKLVDYDPANNNGNIQWVMGGGADSQPYYRIFNPWLQSKEHDPDCIYIKTWIPELKDVDKKYIHTWNVNYNVDIYPKPICDYTEQTRKVLELYKKYLEK
jgi:deoxyribodipyrimidine photo-lyase